jgi:hypothetical protein
MSMGKAIHDFCLELEMSGRKIDRRAVKRLVSYWAVRTPLSVHDICQAFTEDLRYGFRLGLSKRGYN